MNRIVRKRVNTSLAGLQKETVALSEKSRHSACFLMEEKIYTFSSNSLSLTEMFENVANHIFSKQSDLRKEIGEIMGGKILELESERLLRTGKECWNEAFLWKIFNSLLDFQKRNWKNYKLSF